MFVFRLFHRDRPFDQIDTRRLAGGSLSVGRDPAADWPLEDDNGTLSRIHFTLTVAEGALLLTDSSTNGTFLGSGDRAPRDIAIPIARRETLRFGALSLLIDEPEETGEALEGTRQILPAAGAMPLPGAWSDGPATARPRHPDESLIEAFCEGAQLDSSALSGEDPAELMRRLGATYQQTVLGLATLMAERTRFKGDHQLDRTTIGAADNNPFKWTPTRRLALSLLCAHEPGFLSGADAVRASFADVALHLAGISAGGNAALLAVIERLSPDAIEAEAGSQRFSLRSTAALCQEVHRRRHAALTGGDRGLIEEAFVGGYFHARAGPADGP